MNKDSNFVVKSFALFNQERNSQIEVYFRDENIWLTQKLMAELFGVDRTVITKHLKNIFDEEELVENSVSAKFAHTALDGKTYQTLFYNLDAIISVGYRVNSQKATQFRIWATKQLKEFILKGYVLDDERLKQGQDLNKNYFKELLERIRSIRASERRIYQQITDIFAECSIDYDKHSDVTREFFATIQNKFHYAISNKTASEIIYSNVSHKKENLGLKTWKNKDRILKSDVLIAKNYLDEKGIKQLERVITGFFDYIEGLIERKRVFTMEEFKLSVDKFLDFQEYKILDGKGEISFEKAKEKAGQEYDIFNSTQHIESDFDTFSKQILRKEKEKKRY
ncbi:MAG: virulence RhuM family protein [Nanoarchaeota archaeon]|nr:virulence RhuM family protein [Nanoarchaeota archaeon]